MKQNLSILVVSPYFAPETHPRAHRWTQICTAWANQGHTITVVCGNLRGQVPEVSIKGCILHRTGYATIRNRMFAHGNTTGAAKPSIITRWLFNAFSKWLRPWFSPDEAAKLFLPHARPVLEDLLKVQAFDLLITVSKPFSPHILGAEIKTKYPALPWIADCGDPWVAGLDSAVPENKREWATELERSTLASATQVSVTNHRLADLFRKQYHLKNIAVIPPLLQLVAKAEIARQPENQEEAFLNLAYYGALYTPERDATLLMVWCKALQSRTPELARRIRIHIYGTVQPTLQVQLAFEPMIRYIGNINKDQIAEAMQSTDILLNIGNSVPFLLPSKLVEYAAANKPILHLGYHDADASTDFLSEWSQSYLAQIWRDGAFAEGEIRKAIPFLLGTRNETPRALDDLRANFGAEAIANAYLEVLA